MALPYPLLIKARCYMLLLNFRLHVVNPVRSWLRRTTLPARDNVKLLRLKIEIARRTTPWCRAKALRTYVRWLKIDCCRRQRENRAAFLELQHEVARLADELGIPQYQLKAFFNAE